MADKTKNYGFPVIIPCYGFDVNDINSAFSKMDTLPIYTKKVDIEKQVYDYNPQQTPSNPVTFIWHCEIGYDGHGHRIFKAHASMDLETASNVVLNNHTLLGSNVCSSLIDIPAPINSDIPDISNNNLSIRGTVGDKTQYPSVENRRTKSIAFNNQLVGSSTKYIRAYVAGYHQTSSPTEETYSESRPVHISIEMKGVINDGTNR